MRTIGLCSLLAIFFTWSHFDTILSSFKHLRSVPRFDPDDLHAAISGIPDPVFVVFGNRGYRRLLANLLCNMALFEGMHEHLFIAVTDESTADYLGAFTINGTVVTLDMGGMDETSAFNSFAYKEIMFLRGLALVELLRITVAQGKTAVWIEPDMHYRESLLTAPELWDLQASTVGLQWDWSCFCGCFIRFPPINASLALYQGIMERMNPPSVMFGSKDDQTLLNEVVYELDIPVTTLNPCRFRTGAYFMKGYADDRRTNCSGVVPAVQHFNFAVGQDAKIEMAKRNGGWYLSDDEQSCRLRPD